MRYLILMFAFMLTGCQVAKNFTNSKNKNELFPIYGVTLGVTTEKELAAKGKKSKQNESVYYIVHGQDFWVDGGSFDSMYLTESDQMPQKWIKLGMDWRLSYNQWKNLLKDMGFSVYVSEPPEIMKFEGNDTFHAELKAIKRTGIPTKIILDFSYSEEISEDAAGTLYSIDIDIPGLAIPE